MAAPVIQAGQAGADQTYIVQFDDDWSGTRTALDRRWKPLDMGEALHRTGSKGLDEFGNQTGTQVSAPYKRWSAWYNAEQAVASRVEGSDLVFGAKLVNTPDPTRTAFTAGGQTFRPDLQRIYLAFRSTWDRVYSSDSGTHITDPNMDARTWGPGHYFEFDADFSGMVTPGFRFSAYLLPAIPNESNAYDSDASNGIENDFPEYDPTPGFEQYLQSKVIGGTAGQTPNGSIDMSVQFPGVDIRSGRHTYGLRWTSTEFVWYFDGIEYQREESLVPQTQHYVILSRECNSGISAANAVPPYIPQDDGIYGFNGNVWDHLGTVPTDVAKIGYFRVWEIDGENSTSTGPPGTGGGTTPVRELKYRVHVDPIAAPGVPITCRVDIVKPLPIGKVAVYAWTHGFGGAGSFADSTAQRTELTITGTSTRVADVDCVVTLVDE